MSAFAPHNSFSMSVTTTSSAATMEASDTQVQIANVGSSEAFVQWGGSAAAATASDNGYKVSVPAGAVMVFTKGGATNISAITASGTATLRVVTGVGE